LIGTLRFAPSYGESLMFKAGLEKIPYNTGITNSVSSVEETKLPTITA